jgi:hypothetical protein
VYTPPLLVKGLNQLGRGLLWCPGRAARASTVGGVPPRFEGGLTTFFVGEGRSQFYFLKLSSPYWIVDGGSPLIYM